MSVPVGKRKKTGLEYYIKAQKLYMYCLVFIEMDFCCKTSTKDVKSYIKTLNLSKEDKAIVNDLVSRDIIGLEVSSCQFIIDKFKNETIDLLEQFMTDLNIAYGLYPDTMYLFHKKRWYVQDAINCCNVLIMKFEVYLQVLPVKYKKENGKSNIKMYEVLTEMLTEEITLLKELKKRVNASRSSIMEREIKLKLHYEEKLCNKLNISSEDYRRMTLNFEEQNYFDELIEDQKNSKVSKFISTYDHKKSVVNENLRIKADQIRTKEKLENKLISQVENPHCPIIMLNGGYAGNYPQLEKYELKLTTNKTHEPVKFTNFVDNEDLMITPL